MYKWSELYLDYITHYGEDSFRRSTVTVVGQTYQLSKWYKGCGFSPEVVNYRSMEEAKQAGEGWTNKGI